MDNITISFDEMKPYIILANIILGILFGTFPLLAGIMLNNRKFGIYGFISAIIGGALLGIFLSFPIACVFTWLILKKSFAKNNADVAVANENSIEVETGNTESR
jgi:uncharacterized membrane protein